MTSVALEALNLTSQWAEISFLVFLRVGAIFALLPVFGEQVIPMRVRLALAIAVTIAVVPSVWDQVGPISATSAAAAVVGGLAMGAFLRLIMISLQIAGTIAAQSTSLAQLLGTPGVEPLPALGQLLFVAGLAAATLLGLHTMLIEYIVISYAIFPSTQVPSGGMFAEVGLDRVRRSFELGFLLAAPFVVASVLYNTTLGAINRAMPHLMVAFVGAPAITLGTLILLFLSAPSLISVWMGVLEGFMLNPAGGS